MNEIESVLIDELTEPLQSQWAVQSILSKKIFHYFKMQ